MFGISTGRDALDSEPGGRAICCANTKCADMAISTIDNSGQLYGNMTQAPLHGCRPRSLKKTEARQRLPSSYPPILIPVAALIELHFEQSHTQPQEKRRFRSVLRRGFNWDKPPHSIAAHRRPIRPVPARSGIFAQGK
jgi:hypothetical protein